MKTNQMMKRSQGRKLQSSQYFFIIKSLYKLNINIIIVLDTWKNTLRSLVQTITFRTWRWGKLSKVMNLHVCLYLHALNQRTHLPVNSWFSFSTGMIGALLSFLVLHNDCSSRMSVPNTTSGHYKLFTKVKPFLSA
jgi:hypothetical protein